MDQDKDIQNNQDIVKSDLPEQNDMDNKSNTIIDDSNPDNTNFSNADNASGFSTTFPTDVETNAADGVSQIFQDSHFDKSSDNKNKIILLSSIAIIVVIGILSFFYFGGEKKEKPSISENEISDILEEKSEELPSVEEIEQSSENMQKEETAEMPKGEDIVEKEIEEIPAEENLMDENTQSPLAIRVLSPGKNQSFTYNVNSSINFNWQGRNGCVLLSTYRDMSVIYRKKCGSGNVNISFQHSRREIYPRIWYWKVSSNEGESEVSYFNVKSPPSLKINLSNINKNIKIGEVITWPGVNSNSYKVYFFNQNDKFNPIYGFITNKNFINIGNQITPGEYFIKILAYNSLLGGYNGWNQSDDLNTALINITAQ